MALNAAFLLGAGFSTPAGMPSTATITRAILLGEADPVQQVFRHTDSVYYLGKPRGREEYVWRVRQLLQLFKGEIDRYYMPWKETTYEDLYYLASQIHDSEYGEYDNPAIQPLIDKLQPVVQLLCLPSGDDARLDWSFRDLAWESMIYIRDIVWHMLDLHKPDKLSVLALIADGLSDSGIDVKDVFTLNHDRLIDEYLTACGIQYADGFGEPVGGVRYFSPDTYDVNDRVRVIKLHGSLDWFEYRTGIGIPSGDDENPSNRRMERHPAILVGTFNKMLKYTDGTFTELQYQLLNCLKRIERLIICGYSFGDKAINTRIVEWMYASENNRIVVIDPNHTIKQHARGAIRNNWDQWHKANRLDVVQKGIEETSWSEVVDHLRI